MNLNWKKKQTNKNKVADNPEQTNKPIKVENSKEKFSIKFINTIKKRWLISGTNTLLLIAILIAITILF